MPNLRIPVEFRITQNDKVVASSTIFFEVDAAGEFEAEAEILAEALDQSAEYKVSAYASALENTVELGSYVENEVDDGLFDDVKDPKHPYFTHAARL